MFDYLQKFNNLPQDLRNKVSTPEAMRFILELEERYRVELAAVVMKVMTKDLTISSLPEHFINEFSLSANSAKSLSEELVAKIFSLVSNYLEIKIKEDLSGHFEVDKNIKEAGLILASEELQKRLKNIVLTYKKGVRDKIDTKNSLMKPVEFGGLGLTLIEVEKLFNVLSGKQEKLFNNTESDPEKKEVNLEKLNKIILEAEGLSGGAYDFKKSLLEKKKVESLPLEDKEILLPTQEKSLNLPLEDKEIFLPEMETPLNLPLEEKVLSLEDSHDNKHELVEKSDSKKEGLLDVIEKEVSLINKNLSENKKEKVNDKLLSKELVKEKIETKTDQISPEKDNVIIEAKTQAKDQIKESVLITTPESKKTTLKEDVKNEPLPINPDFKRPAPSPNFSKPRLDDIKPMPKIMNPVDELRFLTLTNFHRLGETAQEISDKIFQKIKLLEKDGYDRMIQGVRAWHASEVNQLYVKMGREAIMSGISLKDAIILRQQKNLPFLKEIEVEAISKLNSRLIF